MKRSLFILFLMAIQLSAPGRTDGLNSDAALDNVRGIGADLFSAVVDTSDTDGTLEPPHYSRFVYPDADGRLVYEANERGDVIPDFSHAGYRGGGTALPDVPVRIELSPKEGDDTERIQAALDRVGQMEPDEEGRRGTVFLKAGTFRISGTLSINRSGVVLRGAGDHEGGTLLVAGGNEPRTLVQIEGEGEWEEIDGTRREIVDDYVPVGARSFTVENAGGFEVGDRVIVYRPSTAEWISAIGMDSIPPNPSRPDALVQWSEGSRDLRFDRVITEIEGDQVTIDAPLTHSLDREYGGGYLFAYSFPGRLEEVGVESLRAVTEWRGTLGLGRDRELPGYRTDYIRAFAEWQGGDRDNPPDSGRASRFASFDAVENAWMRDVTVRHFSAGASSVGRTAKWVTIQDSRNVEPVSHLASGGRYSFPINGQLTLVQRCYATDGRHDFVTGATVAGPNVYLDCVSRRSQAAAGPHQRYAVGTLYDNVKIKDSGGDHASTGGLEIRNRGPLGSGHGWSGVNHVAWNSVARWIMVENPPLAQNWAIGCIETDPDSPRPPFSSEARPPSDDPPQGNGHWDSYGRHVDPRSLYFAQLEDRLGTEAVGAVARESQVGDLVPESQETRPLRESDFVLDGEYGSAGSRVEKVGRNHFMFHRGRQELGDEVRTSWAQFEIHSGLRGNELVIDIPGAGLPHPTHNMHYAYSLDGEHWTPILQELAGPDTSRIRLGPFESDHLYFGWQIPLSNELGMRFVERWANDPATSRFVTVHDIGESVEGRRLYRFEITDPDSPVPREDRWVHWVSSSHPHEGKARWRIYGVADWLLSDEAEDHRKRNIWHITFMMSPDAVARGASRLNMEGIDMNRAYRPEGAHPSQAHEAYLFQREIEHIMATDEPLTTFTDMHVWGNKIEPMIRPGPEFGTGSEQLGEWTELREIMERKDPQDLLIPLDLRTSDNTSMWDGGVYEQFGITSSIVEGGGTLDTQEENIEAGRVYARSYDAFYQGTKSSP